MVTLFARQPQRGGHMSAQASGFWYCASCSVNRVALFASSVNRFGDKSLKCQQTHWLIDPGQLAWPVSEADS